MNPAACAGTSEEPPALTAHEVQLWHIDTEGDDDAVAAAWASATADERDRAVRLHGDIERARFLLRRQALRAILACHTGRPAQALAFVTGAQGKPALAPDGAATAPVSFNLSRSGGTTLLAVARAGALGVDIERVRPVPEWQRIARRHCTDAEAHALAVLDADRRDAAFLQLWTRKEAVVKALGGGLSIALDAFEVDLRPQPPRAAVHWRRQGPWPTDLQWLPVPPLAGHAVALVTRRDVDRCRLLRWTGLPGQGQAFRSAASPPDRSPR